MPQPIDSSEERRLLQIVKTAVDQVDDVNDPTAIITKLARDHGLGPGQIRLVCCAYNTGRQTAQWKSASTAVEKTASFPTADAEKVISAVYTDSDKAAAVSDDYFRPPDWLTDRRTVKAAVDLTKYQAPPVPQVRDVDLEWMRKQGSVDAVRQAYENARGARAESEDKLASATGALQTYFRKAAMDRLAFSAVEHAAAVYHGGAVTPLFDLLHSACPREKRAADVPMPRGPVDSSRPPFSVVAECLKIAKDVASFRLAEAAAKKKYESTLPKPAAHAKCSAVDDHGVRLLPDTFLDKAAGFLSGAAAGGMAGGALSRLLPQKTVPELINETLNKIDSPEHQNMMRAIRARAMLNSMLTDPDDPISGADPEAVLSRYNEMVQLAPRAAEQPAVMKPLLRKSIAGASEPFEAQQTAEIEKTLAQARRPNAPEYEERKS